MANQAIATRLPSDLTGALTAVCKKLGLRKNHVIEMALRDKIEDLLDAEDLKEGFREASGFHAWESVKREMRARPRR